jgi:hypothetical protein
VREVGCCLLRVAATFSESFGGARLCAAASGCHHVRGGASSSEPPHHTTPHHPELSRPASFPSPCTPCRCCVAPRSPKLNVVDECISTPPPRAPELSAALPLCTRAIAVADRPPVQSPADRPPTGLDSLTDHPADDLRLQGKCDMFDFAANVGLG